MVPAPFQVVLDANVLFPFTLRDTLLRSAEKELYLLGWSPDILEEMRRNLVDKGFTTEQKSWRLVEQMKLAFPESEITDYEFIVPCMQNDVKDRHIVAAAVKAGAQLIVTQNLKDFKILPDGVEAKSADDFLCDLFDLAPATMKGVIVEQAQALRNPPRSVDDIHRGLAKFAPKFVTALTAS